MHNYNNTADRSDLFLREWTNAARDTYATACSIAGKALTAGGSVDQYRTALAKANAAYAAGFFEDEFFDCHGLLLLNGARWAENGTLHSVAV